MEAQEKSKELFRRFYKYCNNSKVRDEYAKQCALIAVDEIIKAKPAILKGFEYELNIKYWQEVKTELEKL